MDNKISIYNPFTDKDVKINPYGLTAKRIYRLYIDDMGYPPDSILPPNLNYNKETGRFRRIKIIKDFTNVRRITYNQVTGNSFSYLRNLIKNYAGQTVHFALKYNYNDVMKERDSIEDVPPLQDGFSGWWDEFSYFFVVDSEVNAFSSEINEGLEPNFQAQLLIMTLDKVNKSNFSQYFMEGVTNCLLKPIREWANDCLSDAKSKSAKYNYQRKIKLCDKYEEEFVNGVPEDRIAEICNKLQIGIEIDLPSTVDNKTKFIEIRSQKKPLKKFKYLNTRLNHIELNKVKSITDYVEVSKKELIEIFNNEKDFKMWKQSKSGITQVNTLGCVYKLKEDEGYKRVVKEFEEEHNLHAFKVEYYDNPALSEFLKENCHTNQSVLFCDDYGLDKDALNHIDMSKSYTRGQDCKFYEGYLGKISDFRQTNKIIGLGIYQIKNINFNGNPQGQGISDVIEKLKVLHDYNAYPSPELKYYQSLGITFDIIGGCWGTGFDIEFYDEMYDKEDDISHYCRWFGTTMTISFKTRYSFDCKDIEFAELNNSYNDDVNIKFNDHHNTGVIEYKKKKVYHQSHIASFITSYARINLMEQLSKFKDINQIIAVQVDGIYYQGDVETTPLFRKKDKITIDYIETDSYVSEKNGRYDFAPFRDHNNFELHIGAGGCGKTHNNLTDKGLCSVLYVAPSWKLSRTKAKEYGIDTSVVAWLVNSDPDKWRPIYNKYSVIVIDEVSMMCNEKKLDIMKRFDCHKIIFCGDLGFQLPPVEGQEFTIDDDIKVVEHTNNRRCKCPKLKKKLDFMRGLIKEGKDFLIGSDQQESVFGIDVVNKDSIEYNIDDLIICPTHKTKDYYSEKYKNLEKYIVLENCLDYSNGDIVYTKPKGVKSELRHAFTIHSIQGETAKSKLYIDMHKMRSLRMLYTAFSRAEYLHQIVIMN
tara:strand:+ start:1447 stop:4221 length:2775 start_codon:yes stop_codon:yes gene_type:complete